ncbi:DUF4262 domain-containing protein [Sphingobacterium sp. DR205]|uniref:DUF4262 domain-containing protein n=1 Tax=Sphingobacterium sp. DR205 TaxID=2713573 RepID=UPI0013E44CA8|nr:DUF4262 domain-containing protein [Sphingobacterium sp. DR205]QIH33465.1 DUF4262 domain-containing protein [Sphingobacterium sp. DR205]
MNSFYFDDPERKLDAWSKDMMDRHGWYVHFIPNDNVFPNKINFHTHGLPESFGHPDLQICFPISTEGAHQILSYIIDRIKSGEQFEPNRQYEKIIGNNLTVEFIEAMECNRKLLRIVFPNKDGNYEGEVFSAQFEYTGI